MADRNDDGTRLGSLFKTAIIAAPLAIGGGMGVSKLSKESTHFSKSVSQLPITNATSPIRQFVNRYVSAPHSGTFKNWQLDKLAGFSANTSLSVEDVRDSFIRAARISDPTGSLYRSVETQISQAMSPQALYEDIAGALRQNQSVYSERALRSFLSDIEFLEGRAEQGLRVSTAPLGTGVSRNIENLTLGQLSPRMRTDIQRAAELMGSTFSIKRYSRPGLEGSELSIRFSGGAAGDSFALRVPEEIRGRAGVITHGTTQQSQYLVGRYGLVEGNKLLEQSFKYEEWMTRRALEDLIPQLMTEQKLSNREINSFVKAFETKMLQDPEWIPTLPGMAGFEGLDVYTELRRGSLRLFKPGGTRLSEFEYSKLLETGGLETEAGFKPVFIGPSPSQVGKGIVTWADPTQYSLFPGAEDFARRPLQRYRRGSEPTARAFAAIAEDPINRAYTWARDPIAAGSPMVRAAFVSSSMGAQLSGTGVSSEGQFLLHERLKEQFGRRMLQQYDISSRSLVELEDILKGGGGTGVWTDINKTLPAGTFLGYDPRGEAVVLPRTGTLLSATAFEKDKSKGDFIRVMMAEDIENLRYAKFFGGAKGMGVFTSGNYMQEVLTKRAGMSQHAGRLYEGIDALISMDELGKNRALHYSQMMTSLWDYTKANLAGGRTHSTLASNFANDPMKFVQSFNKLYFDGKKFDHDRALKLLVSMSRQANLTAKQMGGVFGAVPEVFGGLEGMGTLSGAERHEIGRGMAYGATQLFFEDVGGGGAGKMATIEPRAFELMGGPGLGGVGASIQKDVAERMVRQYPHMLMGQGSLLRSSESLMKRIKGGASMSASELIDLAGDEVLPAEASYLRLNAAGLEDVYIPGAGQIGAMSDYITDAGKIVHSDLTTAYRNLVDAANEYQNGKINLEGLQFRVRRLKKTLEDTRIAMVTSKGGLLRERLPGSQFLTSVEPTMVQAAQLPERTVGITATSAEKMFNQLENLGMYAPDKLGAMRQRFLGGEAIPGLVGRHPYIGAYSTQAAYLKLVPGNEAVAIFNERQMQAMAFAGRLSPDDAAAVELSLGGRAFQGNQRVIGEMEKLGAHMLGPIRMSPAVGLAADFDADIVSVSLAGPQLEEPLRELIENPGAYEEYAIRQQLIKPKAPKGTITLGRAEEMAEAAIKLGLTSKESGRIGKVSNLLQQYRAAMMVAGQGISAQDRLRGLGLLEWLEQTPIAGKHIAPGKAAETIYQLGDIEEALMRKDAAAISQTTRKILESNKLAQMGILDEGVTIALGTGAGSEVQTRFINGLDLGRTSENLVNAMSAFENMKVGDMSAARLRQVLLGKASPTQSEISALRDKNVLSMSPFGDLFQIPERQMTNSAFKQATEKVTAIQGQLGALGKKAITHAKPLLIGTGIAVGLANLLSAPPALNVQYNKAPPQPNMRSGSGGTDAPIHPDAQVRSNPSVETVESYANKARLLDKEGMKQRGYAVSVKGTSRSGVDYQALNNQARQLMRGNTRINSTVSDRRSSLSSQKISDILYED